LGDDLGAWQSAVCARLAHCLKANQPPDQIVLYPTNWLYKLSRIGLKCH